MDDTKIPALLDALLTPEGDLRGPDTREALGRLGRPEVARVFAEAARALDEAHEPDEVALRVVAAAHAVRVAVAVRWGHAGATNLERRLAAHVDAALREHRHAVLMACEEADLLAALDLAEDRGAEVGWDSWWGFLASPEWLAQSAAFDRALVELAGRHAFDEGAPDRHERAWESHMLEHGYPSGDSYFGLQVAYDGEVYYGQNTRDWPDCEREDLACEWAEAFERQGRRLYAW